MTTNNLNLTPDSPIFYTRQITPSDAEALLTKNTSNRRITKSNVKLIANQMKAGAWSMNGETIKIAKDGTLLDGQHRLLALIESGTTQAISFACGVDRQAFTTIDTGRKRTASDTLGLAGIKDSSMVAAVTKAVLLFDANGTFTRAGVGVPSAELLAAVEKDPRLTEACAQGRAAANKTKLLSPATLALGYYYLGQINATVFDEFMDKLIEGYGVKGDPELVLRKHLMDLKIRRVSTQADITMPYLIRAFEYRLNERKVSRLLLRRDISDQMALIQHLRKQR